MQSHKKYLRSVSVEYTWYILYLVHNRNIHDPPGQVIKCELEFYEVSRMIRLASFRTALLNTKEYNKLESQKFVQYKKR